MFANDNVCVETHINKLNDFLKSKFANDNVCVETGIW